MKKKLFVCMIIYAFLIIFLSGCIDNNLDIEYKTIQESIDHANCGDTIYIQGKIKIKQLSIAKSVVKPIILILFSLMQITVQLVDSKLLTPMFRQTSQEFI